MASIALRRRLAALEASLGEESNRKTVAAEFDNLVHALDAAVASAKDRAANWPANDPRRRAPLVASDAWFSLELASMEEKIR